ncbi:hypothetical protein PABY_18050 [Pyrodictium abyssi]|uniref:Uncharacterized protein n=2 Tax=Pyrodictium abyssi TaxID=54256 RepID=A0ABM8IZM7_9CREN|nr:hypothetical protein PABY_18050 [Pyrodictium abyssi]
MLSGGMVRKMLLAMVLSADVPVYYLDEPTVGLDVENRLKLWDILRRRAKAGSTILVTSHYLNEISSICDKVLLIKDGRVAAFGEPEELGRRYLSGFYSKIVVMGEYSSREHTVRRVGKNTIVYTRSRTEEREVIDELEDAGLPFRVEELTIEDIFLAVSSGDAPGYDRVLPERPYEEPSLRSELRYTPALVRIHSVHG